MEKLTLKDIARVLNKSISTVSKALSDNPEISTATKKEVLDFVHKHNFQLNTVASGLRTGKNKILGLILPRLDHSFYADILCAIESEAAAIGYTVVVRQNNDDVDEELKCIQHLEKKGIDGLIIAPVSSPGGNQLYLQRLINRQLPVVVVDRVFSSLQTHKFGFNYAKIMYEAVCYLHDSRHKRRIAIILGDTGETGNTFLQGYFKGLKNSKIELKAEYVVRVASYEYSTYTSSIRPKIRKLLTNEEPVDAIIATSEVMMDSLLEILKNIPPEESEHVDVVGFSNSRLSKLLQPNIKCIHLPGKELGKQAFKKLMKVVNSEESGASITFPVEVVEAKFTFDQQLK